MSTDPDRSRVSPEENRGFTPEHYKPLDRLAAGCLTLAFMLNQLSGRRRPELSRRFAGPSVMPMVSFSADVALITRRPI